MIADHPALTGLHHRFCAVLKVMHFGRLIYPNARLDRRLRQPDGIVQRMQMPRAVINLAAFVNG